MTKRTLLSDSSKVFDPIGWIPLVIIAFKSLIQQTWVEGVSWHEELPILFPINAFCCAKDQQNLLAFKIRVVSFQLKYVQSSTMFSVMSLKREKGICSSRFCSYSKRFHWNASLLKKVASVKQMSGPPLELCETQRRLTFCSKTAKHLKLMSLHERMKQ